VPVKVHLLHEVQDDRFAFSVVKAGAKHFVQPAVLDPFDLDPVFKLKWLPFGQLFVHSTGASDSPEQSLYRYDVFLRVLFAVIQRHPLLLEKSVEL